MTDPISLDAAQRFVVSCGLTVEAPGDVTSSDLVALLPWAVEHRLIGLLHEAAVSLGSAVPEDIAGAHLAMLRHAIGVEVDACRAVQALRAAGIESVVFKGVGAAHLDYADPALRTFYDVDLLVLRSDLPSAVRCLEDARWCQVESKPGSRWEERFARAVQFVSPSGIELDLHAALGSGYFGARLDHGSVVRAAETFELGGLDVRAFDVDARLLVSSYALVLSRGGHLRLLRDVAQHILVSQASFERAAALAGDGDVVIARALQIVDQVIGLPSDVRMWMASVPTSWAQRRGLALARRAETDGWRSDALGEMLGLGNGDRARYATAIVGSQLRALCRRGG